MIESDFKDLYKTWPSDRLLDIIDNPEDYQPLSLEAARAEIAGRQLTEENLADAKEIQALRQKDKAEKQQKVKDIEARFISAGYSIAHKLNPIQRKIPTLGKHIRLIALFIGALFIYHLFKEFDLLWLMITDDPSAWDITMVLYFLPLVILPTSGLLLWFKQKLGWFLSVIYFSYMAVGAIPLFFMELNRLPSVLPSLDEIFPIISPMIYIGRLFLFGGLTWILCRGNMRDVFQIDKTTMFVALGIGIGTILLTVIYFSS